MKGSQLLNSLFFLFILGITASCAKDEPIIPNVSFSANIYLNDPAFNTNPFIVKYDVSRRRIGINGVVIYRMGMNEYYVFDLMCPNEKQLTCMVHIDDGALARCGCCNSLFLIATANGGVIEGPSRWPLKTYRNRVVGDYLNIWN